MRKRQSFTTTENQKYLKDKVLATPKERRVFAVKFFLFIAMFIAAAVYLGLKMQS